MGGEFGRALAIILHQTRQGQIRDRLGTGGVEGVGRLVRRNGLRDLMPTPANMTEQRLQPVSSPGRVRHARLVEHRFQSLRQGLGGIAGIDRRLELVDPFVKGGVFAFVAGMVGGVQSGTDRDGALHLIEPAEHLANHSLGRVVPVRVARSEVRIVVPAVRAVEDVVLVDHLRDVIPGPQLDRRIVAAREFLSDCDQGVDAFPIVRRRGSKDQGVDTEGQLARLLDFGSQYFCH